MNYYVGLDNGGTTTKAAIFDAKGKEIATASTATKMLVPQPGFTERDMEEMWEANCLVIREALKKSGAAPADIRCVAVGAVIGNHRAFRFRIGFFQFTDLVFFHINGAEDKINQRRDFLYIFFGIK